MWLLASIFACGGDPAASPDPRPEPPGECDTVDPTVVGVLNQITFARADAYGVSHGFDLDGAVTEAGGDAGCGVGDYVSPDGEPGVDNAFSPIVTLLESTEAQAIEAIIQETINTGQLLLFFELEDVDDRVDDSCVSMTLLRGAGDPVVGNERIVSGQTFERDEATFASRVEGVAIEDGTVIAGPLTLELPITVFNVDIQFVLQDALVRVDLREDGTYWGIIAGGIVIDEILAVALEENVNDEVAELLSGVLGIAADLAPDETGACQQISVTLEFEGVSAFFFADEA